MQLEVFHAVVHKLSADFVNYLKLVDHLTLKSLKENLTKKKLSNIILALGTIIMKYLFSYRNTIIVCEMSYSTFLRRLKEYSLQRRK